jgi:hypothetical protein
MPKHEPACNLYPVPQAARAIYRSACLPLLAGLTITDEFGTRGTLSVGASRHASLRGKVLALFRRHPGFLLCSRICDRSKIEDNRGGENKCSKSFHRKISHMLFRIQYDFQNKSDVRCDGFAA